LETEVEVSSKENKVDIYESEAPSYSDEDEMHEVYRKKSKRGGSKKAAAAKMTVELIGKSVGVEAS
jgi:hypothetical protein